MVSAVAIQQRLSGWRWSLSDINIRVVRKAYDLSCPTERMRCGRLDAALGSSSPGRAHPLNYTRRGAGDVETSTPTRGVKRAAAEALLENGGTMLPGVGTSRRVAARPNKWASAHNVASSSTQQPQHQTPHPQSPHRMDMAIDCDNDNDDAFSSRPMARLPLHFPAARANAQSHKERLENHAMRLIDSTLDFADSRDTLSLAEFLRNKLEVIISRKYRENARSGGSKVGSGSIDLAGKGNGRAVEIEGKGKDREVEAQEPLWKLAGAPAELDGKFPLSPVRPC